DVANEQRKIVYKFRNQLLDPDYDIDAKIDEIRREYIEHILSEAGIFEGGTREDFNLKKVKDILKEEINFDLDIEALSELEYEELLDSIVSSIKASYDEKMSVLDDEIKRNIESELYLKELDNAWREHLYAMDNMKTGIRLRAYNQKDPLVEYKKESFNLFSELINDIKFNTIRTLQVIQFQLESPEEEAKRMAEEFEMQRKLDETAISLNHAEAQEDENSNTVKKPARNEPCPCGSGKKYKQCCGKSGPKKGVFAS
ncbi:MAG: SEC-C metal-binding domain-containing protein, partial [Campylobacterales bacterium]